MQTKLVRWMAVLAGLLACAVLAVLVFIYLDYSTARALPTLPLVSLTETIPESPVAAGQSVVVFGRASDPDGISQVQLWVNGQQVASQVNSSPGSGQPVIVTLAWIPTGAANYLVALRALDTTGSAGQSEPILVEALQRAYTHEVAPGETIAQIAADFGTTPAEIEARNPEAGGSLVPGTTLDVPAAPESDAGDGAGAPADDVDVEEPPRVDPPAPVPPPSGDETPARPARPEYWRYLNLPGRFVCLFNPSVCAPLPADPAPAAPSAVGVKLHEPCNVGLGWQDTTTDESGFRVYRALIRPFRMDLVGLLQPSPGSGTYLSFTDEAPPNGKIFYVVAADNARGQTWSAPSQVITVDCRPPGVAAGYSLTIEALDMTVRDPYERLYCYASLSGSPFERIPHSGQFLEQAGGTWNIARHFGGANKRQLFSDGGPVQVIAECLGWQAGTLINLGRFERSHPPEEWDGRHITAGPSSGTFSVTYRILPFSEPEEDVGSSTWTLLPDIPPPYNLRTALNYRISLPEDAEGNEGGALAGVMGLAWDYSVNPADPRPPIDFRVYYRIDGEDTPMFYYETNSGGNPTAPQKTDRCDATVYYSVTAVVRVDESSPETFESPPSEELAVPPRCAKLEITLISFVRLPAPIPPGTYDGEFTGTRGGGPCIGDCGPVMEAYGWMTFNERRVSWNRHCDSCTITRTVEYTSLEPGTVVPFEGESINAGSGYGVGHNVFTIPMGELTSLWVNFGFSDHDGSSGDDLICQPYERNLSAGTRAVPGTVRVLEPRSSEEWLLVDQDIVVADHDLYRHCEITFHVRGVP